MDDEFGDDQLAVLAGADHVGDDELQLCGHKHAVVGHEILPIDPVAVEVWRRGGLLMSYKFLRQEMAAWEDGC